MRNNLFPRATRFAFTISTHFELVLSTTSFYLLDGNKLGGLLDDKGKGERCPGRSCANG